MAITALTGANGTMKYCTADGSLSLWADASFDFKLSTSTASHPRTGKRSDYNVPGKLSVSISAKNILRSAEMMMSQISDDGTTPSTSPLDLTPRMFDLEFAGTDAAGKYIKVVANNCFLTGSGFAAGDAGTIMTDAVSFGMTDIDADLVISDSL